MQSARSGERARANGRVWCTGTEGWRVEGLPVCASGRTGLVSRRCGLLMVMNDWVQWQLRLASLREGFRHAEAGQDTCALALLF